MGSQSLRRAGAHDEDQSEELERVRSGRAAAPASATAALVGGGGAAAALDGRGSRP